jgi:hypothetical protein
MTTKKNKLYTMLIIGSIGMVIVLVVAFKYTTLAFDSQAFGLTSIGIAIVFSYIYQLERLAGVSNKIIWA